MNRVETEWWTLALPQEWWAEAEGDSVLVGDRDDVGCIEISTLRKDHGRFDTDEVERIARAESGSEGAIAAVTLGEFKGYTAAFREEGAAVTEWFLGCAELLLFITYSCDEENEGLDEAAVTEILDTLEARD